MSKIELIVGLGNPGAKYEATRHNVGFWFVEQLARSKGASFRPENKFHGDTCQVNIDGQTVRLIKPTTYMNHSGQAVRAIAQFYRINVDSILVVHDELDIAPGELRVKQGGGHGGHNGLRDIIAHMGSKEFVRLRIGIGHPGQAREVTNYVLGQAGSNEQNLIEQSIDDALHYLPLVIAGEMQKAMNHLHSR
ncbi:aminoacyl-tRNA hydrolase [Kaarinaea lacus]